MKSLRIKLFTAISMFVVALALLIVGVWAIGETQTITMNGSVNFEIADKSLYIKDVKLQNGLSEAESIPNFLPGFINENFNLNLGSNNVNDYGSFALYFYIINTVIDGQTTAYSATASCTQAGVDASVSGIIEEGSISPEQITPDTEESGVLKLIVSATPGTTVDLSTIKITINEYQHQEILTDFEFELGSDGQSLVLTKYTGSEANVAVPSGVSISYNNFVIESYETLDETLAKTICFGNWNYVDSNGERGTLSYIDSLTFDLSSLAFPIEVAIDYKVSMDSASADNVDWITYYMQCFEELKAQGHITGGLYVTLNGYPRTHYNSITEVMAFITQEFGSIENALAQIFPLTLELENPILTDTGFALIEGDDYTITEIGECAFALIDDINQTAEKIAYSILIYSGAIMWGPTSISLPQTITNIGSGAFWGCNSLTYITLPSNLGNIGQETFYLCVNLMGEMIIPEGITSIGESAFFGCDGLTSITLPSSLQSIGNNVFSYCYALAEVYNYSNLTLTTGNGGLNENVKVVYNASDFTGGKPASRVKIIGNIQYYEYENDFIALAPAVQRGLLTNITLDSRTTEVNDYAFHICSSLTSITLPSNLIVIGENAFNGCPALVEIYNYSNLILTAGSSNYGAENVKVVYNASDLTGGKPASRVKIIGDIQYYEYEDEFIALAPTVQKDLLTNITLESRTTEIHNNAFYGCGSLTSVNLSNCTSLTSIGSYAFYLCSDLTSVSLPSSLTSIGENAFDNCSSLTSISLPSNINMIGRYAFQNCTNLISVSFSNTTGWFVTDNPSATSGTTVTVTTPNTNASNLKEQYSSYYWKR